MIDGVFFYKRFNNKSVVRFLALKRVNFSPDTYPEGKKFVKSKKHVKLLNLIQKYFKSVQQEEEPELLLLKFVLGIHQLHPVLVS